MNPTRQELTELIVGSQGAHLSAEETARLWVLLERLGIVPAKLFRAQAKIVHLDPRRHEWVFRADGVRVRLPLMQDVTALFEDLPILVQWRTSRKGLHLGQRVVLSKVIWSRANAPAVRAQHRAVAFCPSDNYAIRYLDSMEKAVVRPSKRGRIDGNEATFLGNDLIEDLIETSGVAQVESP